MFIFSKLSFAILAINLQARLWLADGSENFASFWARVSSWLARWKPPSQWQQEMPSSSRLFLGKPALPKLAYRYLTWSILFRGSLQSTINPRDNRERAQLLVGCCMEPVSERRFGMQTSRVVCRMRAHNNCTRATTGFGRKTTPQAELHQTKIRQRQQQQHRRRGPNKR